MLFTMFKNYVIEDTCQEKNFSLNVPSCRDTMLVCFRTLNFDHVHCLEMVVLNVQGVNQAVVIYRMFWCIYSHVLRLRVNIWLELELHRSSKLDKLSPLSVSGPYIS